MLLEQKSHTAKMHQHLGLCNRQTVIFTARLISRLVLHHPSLAFSNQITKPLRIRTIKSSYGPFWEHAQKLAPRVFSISFHAFQNIPLWVYLDLAPAPFFKQLKHLLQTLGSEERLQLAFSTAQSQSMQPLKQKLWHWKYILKLCLNAKCCTSIVSIVL